MPHRALNILLVEDNPGDARLIVEDLREPDVQHNVMQSRRLAEAIQCLHDDHEGRIDVVVLDLSLPDASDLEAVAGIRAAAPRLPIVVLTGLADENVAFRAVEEGVQDYLVKGKVNGSLLVRALRYAIERKRADEASRREEEAARAATLRETVMGILGHDLSIPLQSIAASADLLLRAEDLALHHSGAVKRIAESSERMADIIGDLLDYAQARLGGGYTLATSEFDLMDVCRQVINENATDHPTRAITLHTKGAAKGRWDRGRMVKVVSKLVANAAHHGRAGSPVKVSVHHDAAHVVLAVHNEGAPIPDDARVRLFEPSYRADPRGGEASTDLGLGLYIVQQIVLGHHGTIEVRSAEGEGTTFTVRLPRG
jgi:sigma-B regulation protein RsbU (phosphoserine phosphatase)